MFVCLFVFLMGRMRFVRLKRATVTLQALWRMKKQWKIYLEYKVWAASYCLVCSAS